MLTAFPTEPAKFVTVQLGLPNKTIPYRHAIFPIVWLPESAT